MQCSIHPEIAATGTCVLTGKPYCGEDLVEIRGKLYFKGLATSQLWICKPWIQIINGILFPFLLLFSLGFYAAIAAVVREYVNPLYLEHINRDATLTRLAWAIFCFFLFCLLTTLSLNVIVQRIYISVTKARNHSFSDINRRISMSFSFVLLIGSLLPEIPAILISASASSPSGDLEVLSNIRLLIESGFFIFIMALWFRGPSFNLNWLMVAVVVLIVSRLSVVFENSVIETRNYQRIGQPLKNLFSVIVAAGNLLNFLNILGIANIFYAHRRYHNYKNPHDLTNPAIQEPITTIKNESAQVFEQQHASPQDTDILSPKTISAVKDGLDSLATGLDKGYGKLAGRTSQTFRTFGEIIIKFFRSLGKIWTATPPLKRYSVMGIITLIIAGAIYLIGFHAWRSNYLLANAYARVKSSDGMTLRHGPSIKDKKILVMGFGELYYVMGEQDGTVTYDGTKSRWYMVEFKGKRGWVWGGYSETEGCLESNVSIKESDTKSLRSVDAANISSEPLEALPNTIVQKNQSPAKHPISDNNVNTAWIPSENGSSAIGRKISFEFPAEINLKGISILACIPHRQGYADSCAANSSPKSLKFEMDNGQTASFNLLRSREFQYLKLPESLRTKRIVLTLLSEYAGTLSKITLIPEVAFFSE